MQTGDERVDRIALVLLSSGLSDQRHGLPG
jgi:hypothetical protein